MRMAYTSGTMRFALLSRPSRLCAIGLLAMSCLAAAAQATVGTTVKDEPPPPPGGVVTGRVIFADTNGPARFTKVLLKSAAPADLAENPFAELLGTPPAAPGKPGSAARNGTAAASKDAPAMSAEDRAELKSARAASAKMMSGIADLLVSTTVGADGNYTFTNVKAGTYYVHATAPGYIDPLSQFSAEDFASTDPAVKQRIAAVAVPVTVSGTDQAHADLRLERGASISGRVLYDDGTPAAGWIVRTVHRPAAAAATGSGSGAGGMGIDMADLDLAHISEMSQTEDTGRFRIAGLPTGDYILEARFTAPPLGHSSFNAIASNPGSPFGGGGLSALQGLKLTVYSGNVFRQSDAKPVSVRAGDDRSGYDLTMAIHAMHSISGMVRARADGHPVNSGTVELTLNDAQGNPDPSLHLVATIQADGGFRFDYVPPGSYTLKAAHAADVTTVSVKRILGSLMAEQKTNHRYGPASVNATLSDTDITDAKIDVPEAAASN